MRVNKKRVGDIYLNTLFGDIWILNKIWNDVEQKEEWTLNLVNDDCQELLKYVKGFKKIGNIFDLLEEKYGQK